jgi:hypothetical protein
MADTAIEVELEAGAVTAADVALLSALIEDDAPVRAKRGPKVKANLAAMTPEELLRHKAEVRRRNYAKRTSMKASGSLPFDEATVRDALADAALMLLAAGAPGSESVMTYLNKLYRDKQGVPTKVQSAAKYGKLKPKLIGFVRD